MSSRRPRQEDSDEEMEVGEIQPSQSAELAYDPDQRPEEKRRVRAQYRQLLGEQNEHRTDLTSLTVEQLLKNQKRADQYFQNVRAPQEAALDSKVMLQNAEMGAAMARAMKHDTEAFDIDDLIGKLITFMGGRLADGDVNEASQDMDVDDTAPLNWDAIGQKAYMYSRKAPCMDFMVGPLSIEVKQRKKTVRSRLEKDKRNEVQPQELKPEEIQRSENETTKMVREISILLNKFGENGVNFFKFIINPESFGQSMENLFYVSFLIREGKAALYPNEENGLLTLYAAVPPGEDDEESVKKQQVFILTPKTWREAKETFKITRPVIPNRHRPEEYEDEIKDDQFLV